MDSQIKTNNRPKFFIYVLLGVLILVVLVLMLGKKDKVGNEGRLSEQQREAIIKSLQAGSGGPAELTAEQRAEVISSLEAKSNQSAELTPEQRAEIIKSLQAQ